MLTLANVYVGYGTGRVIQGISLGVGAGEVVGLLGRNGAGKTTTLKSVLGVVRVQSGSVRFANREISRWPAHKIPRLGIGYVPQGRRVFPQLTVRENLLIGWTRVAIDRSQLDQILKSFPQIREHLDQRAGTLSGGEQQMVAIARALLMRPRLILLDEPTEGLMPTLVQEVERLVRDMRDGQLAVLLAEQRLETALRVCDRIYVLEKGSIVWEGTPSESAVGDLRRRLELRLE